MHVLLPSLVMQTWLRVRLGFHTGPQVLVGACLGSVTATAWFAAGTGWVLPALHTTAGGPQALCAATLAAGVAFAVRNVAAWVREQAMIRTREDVAAAARQENEQHDSAQDGDEAGEQVQLVHSAALVTVH
jgi:hypothetical protein